MNEITDIQKERLAKAAESYREIEKLLLPFLRPRKIVDTSTQGQWQKASSTDAFHKNDLPLKKFTNENV